MKVYLEVAPDEELRRTVWYHGTRLSEPRLLLKGLKARKELPVTRPHHPEELKSAGRKVYMSARRDIARAYTDTPMHKQDIKSGDIDKFRASGKGVIAVIKGSSLKDVDPDEDRVTELISRHTNDELKHMVDEISKATFSHATSKLPHEFLSKVYAPGHGNSKYAMFSKANEVSKFLIRSMPNKLKLDIIKNDPNRVVAHKGPIKPHYILKKP